MTVTSDGSQVHPHDPLHYIYKVSMKNGETWAVDVTEAQYGHHQLMYRWRNYEQENCAKITERRQFGYLRSAHGSFRDSPITKALVEAIEQQIPYWVKEYGGRLNNILKGPEKRFQAQKQGFLNNFESHVQKSLDQMSESSIRSIEEPKIPRKLAQNASDTRKLAGSTGEAQRVLVPSSNKDAMEFAGKLYVIRAIAGKGRGLVATTNIAKGTRILSEFPLFEVRRDISDIAVLESMVTNEIEKLRKGQQQAFFDLANVYGAAHSKPLGIARTNVLPLGSNARTGGLFIEASRINHSCRHNAQNTWNENIKRITIHALRDIEEGQEITISYLPQTREYAERQSSLKKGFKFDCKCELCSLPPAQREMSDFRLKTLREIDDAIGELIFDDVPETALPLLHKMMKLFTEEGIWDAGISRAYNDAYQIAIASGDMARAQIFAGRAYDVKLVIEGDDSPATTEMKRRGVEHARQTPQKMSKDQFENWLWMLNEG